MQELDWSAPSPDLNQIEHHWDELEPRLQASPSSPMPELTNSLMEELLNISINTSKPCGQIPRRVKAIHFLCVYKGKRPKIFGNIVYVILENKHHALHYI